MQKLPSRLANILSSGTIVTGVDAVVKELIENSLDAESSSIRVVLHDYGLAKIDVIDNGKGIASHDYENVCKRYYTSKLKEESQLHSLDSFGFRGEALHSICMYSEVQISTRRADEGEDVGTQLKYDSDGNLVSKSLIAREVGTTVTIVGLFNKFPVRKIEARKNKKTGLAKVLNLLYGTALASRGASLSAHCDGKHLFSVQNSLDVDAIVTSAFGAKEMSSLNSFVGEQTRRFRVKISGRISKLSSGGRSKNDRQFVIMNGRFVKMLSVNQAVVDVFRRYIGQFHSRVPFLIVFVETDREHVDVNVSPNKKTILMNSDLESELLQLIKETLVAHFSEEKRSTWTESSYISSSQSISAEKTTNMWKQSPASLQPSTSRVDESILSNPSPIQSTQTSPASISRIDTYPRQSVASSRTAPAALGQVSPAVKSDVRPCSFCLKRRKSRTQVISIEAGAVERGRKKWRENTMNGEEEVKSEELSTRIPAEAVIATSEMTGFNIEEFNEMAEGIVGQFNKGYIICKHRDRIWAIDQHAADEKIKFEKYMKNGDGITSQPLFLPQQMNNISVGEEQDIIDHMKDYERLGFRFQVDEAQEPTMRIQLLSKPMINGTVFEFADVVTGGPYGLCAELPNPRISPIERAFATMACRAAVKIGDELKSGEMKIILTGLATLKNPFLCPHGRPVLSYLMNKN